MNTHNTPPSEFARALEFIEEEGGIPSPKLAIVIHALKIADRLLQEPSEGMSRAGAGYVITRTGHIHCFEVMRDQLLKEIEG